MANGIQIFNAAGGLDVEPSSNIGRIFTYFDVGGAAGEQGSYADDRFSGAIALSQCIASPSGMVFPHKVYISGTVCYYTSMGFPSRIFVIGKTR